MKMTFTLAALTLGATMALSQAGFAGAVLDGVMKNQLMIETTDRAYPPFSYIDDKGEVIGFDIDVAKEFAKRLGVDMKTETPSWEIITAGNWKGRWDICICSMTPTKERAEVLDFVVQYYSAPAVVVVNTDNNEIKGAADLSGKKVGAQSGTTYEKYIMKDLVIDIPGAEAVTYPFNELTPVPYDSEDTAFQDLALGTGKRLDAIVSNYLTAMERVKNAPDKFKIVGDPVFGEPIWVSVDKGDPEWQAKIKEIFKQMSDDGTLKQISEKWVGRDITTKQ
ncbi:transporter substrate-binding domain-containing protein [Nordella sp. HKS 07]|uniref:transporter substrate-binding domain-containing protein n=1 Tax=Nordella sp. HKS 07 TaxID=2712222 RepID=UPI0019CF94CE|nr:transporter substrate-binding domain-containing protein [Nordella sp. HKS 07]